MKEFTPKRTITIRSAGSDITALGQALENDFSKDELRKILDSFSSLFKTCNVVSSTMIVSERIPSLTAKPGTRKSELANALASILSSREVIEAYLNEMPKEVVGIYRDVYRSIYMSRRSAEENFGRPIGSPKKGSGWSYYSQTALDLLPVFSMLKLEALGSWSSQTLYLTFPPSTRSALGPVLVPHSLDVPVLPDYVPAKNETLYSVQAEVEPLYPVVHSLYLNGTLELGKNKVTATTLKKISRQAAFRDFFPDTKDRSLKNLAGTLFTSIFCLNAINSLAGRKVMAEPVNKVARNIISFIRNSTDSVISFYAGLLLNKPYQTIFSQPACSRLIKTLLDVLSSYAAYDWLTAGGIMAALRNTPDSENFLIPFNVVQLNNYSVHNQFSYKYLSPSTVISQFTRPIAEMLCATLAVFGMAEIVFSEPAHDAPSPMAGLKAIRLTPLGRYALGLTEEYIAELTSNGPLFEFDSDRLLLHTLGENNPYESLMSKYLLPVGEHRFRATAENFIDGCNTRQDLERKIENFRLFTGATLPPVWEAFFNDLLRKSSSFSAVNTGYYLLNVNPDDHDLLAVISDDPVVREITVCAEGYMLLVKVSDFVKFCDAMRRHGYIV